MTKPKRSLLLFLLPFSLLLLSLCFQKACISGVAKGLEIALQRALPSLFPSLVLSRMMTLSLQKKGGKSALLLPLFLGLFCGFPIGAVTVASLFKEGALSRNEGETLLFFCNNTGPAFLVGVCGIGLMGEAKYGWFLFLLQGALAIFFFFFFFHKKLFRLEKIEKTCAKPVSLSQLITQSLSGAANSFLYICACILFFSFVSELFSFCIALSPISTACLSLFLELTGGMKALIALPPSLAFPLCAAGCGWSSLSVHIQTVGCLEGTGLSLKKYFLGKLVFSALLFLGAEILQKLL